MNKRDPRPFIDADCPHVGPHLTQVWDVRVRPGDISAAARDVAAIATARADALDSDGAFPSEDIALLHRRGLLEAPFPIAMGGDGIGIGDPERLCAVLSSIGRGSLALGRLYEGHVNAVALVARYGSDANLDLLWREAAAGRLGGVWMAGEPLRLVRERGGSYRLRGRKLLCSGARHIERPLVAADLDGQSLMLLPNLADMERADVSGWRAHGMRATETGTVDFDDLLVDESEVVGSVGDYLRSPYFRGGAWRVLAVQLGGLKGIFEAYREQLKSSAHRDHPIQQKRFGEATVSMETARLWVESAAHQAEGPSRDAARIDAYVDLARNAFEGVALQVVAHAEKAIGLNAFLRNNSLERLIRDMRTYLRQPALDISLLSAAAFHLRVGDEARSDDDIATSKP